MYDLSKLTSEEKEMTLFEFKAHKEKYKSDCLNVGKEIQIEDDKYYLIKSVNDKNYLIGKVKQSQSNYTFDGFCVRMSSIDGISLLKNSPLDLRNIDIYFKIDKSIYDECSDLLNEWEKMYRGLKDILNNSSYQTISLEYVAPDMTKSSYMIADDFSLRIYPEDTPMSYIISEVEKMYNIRCELRNKAIEKNMKYDFNIFLWSRHKDKVLNVYIPIQSFENSEKGIYLHFNNELTFSFENINVSSAPCSTFPTKVITDEKEISDIKYRINDLIKKNIDFYKKIMN